MAVLVSKEHETAKLANVKESLDHEYNDQVKTNQLLADLKDKEAVAREMIAILRGERGRDARYERKAALKVLAKVKGRRALTEQSLRRSQNRLRGLEAQLANVNQATAKKARDLRMNNLPTATESLPITAEIHGTASSAARSPLEGTSTARLGRVTVAISGENLLSHGCYQN
jgi:small-conductance mechanosensitive channel